MLPLRLSVEPFLRTFIGSACFILPSVDEENLCYAISNHGLVAFVMNRELQQQELIKMTQLPEIEWPRYSVVRSQSGTEFSWYLNGIRCEKNPLKEDVLRLASDQPLTRPVAKTILESITRYYARQVLEPSIRGFLGILEKQFPRNDLYLFELLQNSVDDGASMVILKSFDLNSDSPGLFFCHNGRSFSPLDILGLASVGLSTKGPEEKKKIGFMGVGFKAVYKRYGSVTIYDHIWSLQFREPRSLPVMEPSHSWVLKPNWITEYTSLDSIIPVSENVTSRTWCHFVLQQPRGGVNAIRADLSHLSLNVPVLLGRQYLLSGERTADDWTLIWENTKYQVVCQEQSPLLRSRRNLENLSESMSGKFVGGNFDQVRMSISSFTQSRQMEQKTFQFLTVSFHPTHRAQEAFELHTKKKWSSQAGSISTHGENHILTEEISIFFEIAESGLPTMRNSSGKIHAILPTKLLMPCPINLQASWLLSVDRQDVQNIAENDWNNCLINQLPRLLIMLSRWIANQVDLINSSRDLSLSLKSFYRLFPKFLSEQTEPKVQVMSHEIVMRDLMHAFKEEKLIPVRCVTLASSRETICFCNQTEVIWLPAPMMKFLSAQIVRSWFGRWPFVSREIDELSVDSLWTSSLLIPTVDLLARKKTSFIFPNELISSQPSVKIREALIVMAALGAMQQSSVSELEKTITPGLEHWPIFLTDTGKMALAQEIVWLDFDELNFTGEGAIFSALRRGALLAAEIASSKSISTSAPTRNPRGNSNSKSSRVPAYLLDADLEQTLMQDSYPDLPSETFLLAKNCVESARLLSPSRVIGIDASCGALLATMAQEQKSPSSKLDVPLLQSLFHWAMKNSRPLALSYLLVNKAAGLKLIPSNEAYVQSTISADSQALDLLPYVSDIYLQGMTSQQPSQSEQFLQSYRSFLIKCGCQTGLSLVANTRPFTSGDKLFLPGGASAELPKLRQSNPSVPLSLPFNLGPLSRKRVEVVDINISPEWQSILKSASENGNISLAENIAEMICLMLKSLDTASIVTAETTPYLRNLLQGRATEESITSAQSSSLSSEAHKSASHRVPSDILKFPPPAFARMFFLPPAQPGAEVRNLGPAGWISTLAHSKWVPASPAGSDETSPSLILSPREVLLTKCNSNPLADIMPLAKLRDHQVRVLLNLNPTLSSLFAWGTVAPAPPLEQFERLCQNQSSSGQPEDETRGWITCSRAKYTEISNLWLSLLLAFQERRLSDTDRSRLFKALNQSRSQSQRHNFILPGFAPNTLVAISRCVSTSSSSSDREEDIVTSSLSQIGYLYDLSSPQQHSSRGDEWILGSYTSYLIDFLALPKLASSKHMAEYLQLHFSAVIAKEKYSPPNSVEKSAFSYCLWLLAKEQLSSSEIQSIFRSKSSSVSGYPSQILDKIRSHFQKRFPEFAVYCTHGHGLENSNLPGEWVSLWSTINSDSPSLPEKVHPVLIDDHSLGPKGCGVLKSSLLKKEHHLEPLAILDHCLYRQQHGSPHLLEVEAFLRAVLDIPSISDPKYFSLSAKSGGGQEPLAEATERFHVVVSLLLLLDFRNIRTASTLAQISEAPLFKCNSLSLVFRFPKFLDQKMCGLAESHTFPVYAIRGAPIKSKPTAPDGVNNNSGNGNGSPKVQPLLVTGSPHDYVPELEELLLLLLYGNHCPSTGFSHNSNVRKALSLLNHLESENEFLKYYERYFAEFLDSHLSSETTTAETDTAELPPAETSSVSTFLKYQRELLEAVRKVKGRQRKPPLREKKEKAERIEQRQNERNGEEEEEQRKRAYYGPGDMPTGTHNKKEEGDIDSKNLGAAESFLSSIPTIASLASALPPPAVAAAPVVSVPLRGQGRGVCNLPAWATSAESQHANENGMPSDVTFPQKRARDEKATTSPQPQPQPSEEPSPASFPLPTPTLPPPSLPNISSVGGAEALEISRGRGRGVSNLPAWMTVPPSALAKEEEDKESDHQRSKRSRPIEESEEQFEDAAPIPELATPLRPSPHSQPQPRSLPQLQAQSQPQAQAVAKEFSFDSLLTDLLELLSHSAEYSLDLSFTSSKLISTLSSVPQLQRIDLERALVGPLRQELLAALTAIQISAPMESRFQRLYDYLTMPQASNGEDQTH